MFLAQRLQVVRIVAVRIAIERDQRFFSAKRAPVVLRFEALHHIFHLDAIIEALAHRR